MDLYVCVEQMQQATSLIEQAMQTRKTKCISGYSLVRVDDQSDYRFRYQSFNHRGAEQSQVEAIKTRILSHGVLGFDHPLTMINNVSDIESGSLRPHITDDLEEIRFKDVDDIKAGTTTNNDDIDEAIAAGTYRKGAAKHSDVGQDGRVIIDISEGQHRVLAWEQARKYMKAKIEECKSRIAKIEAPLMDGVAMDANASLLMISSQTEELVFWEKKYKQAETWPIVVYDRREF